MSSIESKRVQFRKYLERAGVIDALSKALIKLYEEPNKPDDAVRFVRKFMCESCPDDAQFDAMKDELEEAQTKITILEQELERYKALIKKPPEEVAELLENGFKSLSEDEVNSGSLLRKYLTSDIINEYKLIFTPAPPEASLLDCIQSGFKNHDSLCGLYAPDSDSYDVFNKLFDPVIRDYHNQLQNENDQLQPETNFGTVEDIENLDPEKKYIISTRIRIARNVEGYPYFNKLTEEQFKELEEKVKIALTTFDDELAGVFLSLKDIDSGTQSEMVKRKILFKKGDKHLSDAGCYRFWPIGRAIFHNQPETFLIWVNEEDHLRIISMARSGDLGDVYSRLIKGLQALEKNLRFGHHPRYGYLTACPTNLGTTLRASVHIRLPHLARDSDRLKTLSNDLNLQIRGTGGEHTAIEDNIMDISNRRRLGFTEHELIKSLQEGIITLIKAEKELEGN